MLYKNIQFNKYNMLDLYTPNTSDFTTIIFIHGGGLVEGEKDYQNIIDLANLFNKAGYGFASIEYRLYPNAKYPDYINDSIDAINYIKNNISKYSGNGKIVLSGQSAGAWICLMLAFNNKLLNVDIAGWLIDSAQTTSHFHVIKYELGLDERCEIINEYAPIYYVKANTRFNPMLLIYYSNDMANRKEENNLLYSTIKRFNNNDVIKLIEFNGTHCNGTCNKNSNGSYDFYDEAIKFLSENNI